MGTAINPSHMSEQRPPQSRRKGRLQLILVLLVAIGPMILATSMYTFKFWVPDNRSSHGELIGNGQSRADLGVQTQESRWQLLVSAPATVQPIASNWCIWRGRSRSAWAGTPVGPAMPWPSRSH